MLTKIRILRLERGLRQVDVVNLTNGRISQHRLSLLERGVSPTVEEAQALAKIFDMPPKAFF